MAPHRAVGQVRRVAREYLTKGKQIYVEGRLQTRQWDDKDGNKRYTTEFAATASCCSAAAAAAAAAASIDRGGDSWDGGASGPDDCPSR